MKWARLIGTILIVTAMVGVSEATGQQEVIFPEIAALAFGLLVAPRMPWRMTLPRMVFCLSACALLGLAVSVCVPGPLAIKVVLAYSLALGLLILSGTTFAPMIAAAVMPVLLGVSTWVYPVSATALALLCAAVRRFFEKAGGVPKELTRPHRGVWGGPRDVLWRLTGVGAVAVLAVWSGAPFIAAPPTLVAYTQLSRRRNPLRKAPWKVVVTCTLCAAIGALSRLVCTTALGLPLCLGAAITTVCVIIDFKTQRRYFPPAAALSILAFLVPELHVAWLPAEVFVGMGLLAYWEKARYWNG